MSELSGGQVTAEAGVDVVQSLGDGRTYAGNIAGGGGGSVAQRLLANDFNIDALRPFAAHPSQAGLHGYGTLLRDEWKLFDTTVQGVARERLPIVSALIARGLTYPLPNALGVMSIEWQRLKGDLVDAEVTMSGLPEATKDLQEWESVNMPVPIFHKEFFYNLRHLAAARRAGRQLDVSHAEVATRKISEMIEKVVFNGLNIAGGKIYGLLNEPNRKTFSLSASWMTATGEQMVNDLTQMIEVLAGPPNNMDGPFVMIVPRGVGARMGNDYKASGDKTIIQRLKEVPGLADVWTSSRLTGSQILLIQLTSDVIQMIDGIQPTMVEWESHGGFQHNFKIIAIMLPRIRSNGWQQSGILQAAP